LYENQRASVLFHKGETLGSGDAFLDDASVFDMFGDVNDSGVEDVSQAMLSHVLF